jgi:hypothetical protein
VLAERRRRRIDAWAVMANVNAASGTPNWPLDAVAAIAVVMKHAARGDVRSAIASPMVRTRHAGTWREEFLPLVGGARLRVSMISFSTLRTGRVGHQLMPL